MREVLSKNADKIENSNVLEELGLEPKKYILVSAHREENVDIESHFYSLMNAINDVADTYGMPVIYSTHPRSLKRITDRGFKFRENVTNSKPFGFFDYNKLQKNAYCVLSDSGTLSEESSMLGFPGVLIRTSTERPEVLDKGSIVVGGIDRDNILSALRLSVAMFENGETASEVPDYQDDNVSIKVVKIIESYTKIIDKLVWEK